jgi:hypothetical protein
MRQVWIAAAATPARSLSMFRSHLLWHARFMVRLFLSLLRDTALVATLYCAFGLLLCPTTTVCFVDSPCLFLSVSCVFPSNRKGTTISRRCTAVYLWRRISATVVQLWMWKNSAVNYIVQLLLVFWRWHVLFLFIHCMWCDVVHPGSCVPLSAYIFYPRCSTLQTLAPSSSFQLLVFVLGLL